MPTEEELKAMRLEINRALASSGGTARAKKLTAKRLSEIARKAANARWAKRKKKGRAK